MRIEIINYNMDIVNKLIDIICQDAEKIEEKKENLLDCTFLEFRDEVLGIANDLYSEDLIEDSEILEINKLFSELKRK